MQRLLLILHIAIFLVSLNSCTSYHYAILNSTDRDTNFNRDEWGDFLQENDTVRITYNFHGENAPVQISIYNKTNEPLYIDWNRSAIIIDDVATSYYEINRSIQGETSINQNQTGGSFSGTITLPHGTNVIPPLARIENTPLTLSKLSLDKIPKEEFSKTKFTKDNSQKTTIHEKEYTTQDTPLLFKSHLTLYSESHDGLLKKPMIFEHSFYINKVIRAGTLNPKEFFIGYREPGDIFYTKKTKGTYLAAGAVVVVGLAAIIGAAIHYEPSPHFP